MRSRFSPFLALALTLVLALALATPAAAAPPRAGGEPTTTAWSAPIDAAWSLATRLLTRLFGTAEAGGGMDPNGVEAGGGMDPNGAEAGGGMDPNGVEAGGGMDPNG